MEEAKTLDIYPIKKTTRVLLFLADFFLVFMLSITLYALATYQLGRLIANMDKQDEEYVLNANARDSTLYGNNLLFYSSSSSADVDNYSTNLEYTCECLVKYYVVGGEENSQYEVFYNYYVGILGNQEAYIGLYSELNTSSFFDLSGEAPRLAESYSEAFEGLFIQGSTLSDESKTLYSNFQEYFFLQAYSSMLSSIRDNDLTYNGVSYLEEQAKVSSYLANCDVLVVSSALIAYALSVFVIHALVPLINKNRRTAAMLFMRAYRVNASTLSTMKKRYIPLFFIYGFAFDAGCVLFIPMVNVMFTELFSLPVLLIMAIASAILCIASLCFFLIDPFGRTMSDHLTFSVIVDEETMDSIYRSKGYEV